MPNIGSHTNIWIFYYQAIFERNYQEALAVISSFSSDVFEFQAAFAPVSLLEGLIYDLMGDSSKAHESYNSARMFLEQAVVDMQDDPRVHRALGFAYAGLERKDDAIRSGKRAVEICPISKDALRCPDSIRDLASIYFRVGEYDKGFDQLDYLLSIPNWHSIKFMSLYPYSFPFEDHPRYKELVKKYSGDGL
jgi:tetratricopeptide (TPR) repeat protein